LFFAIPNFVHSRRPNRTRDPDPPHRRHNRNARPIGDRNLPLPLHRRHDVNGQKKLSKPVHASHSTAAATPQPINSPMNLTPSQA
jgi:hypothetical protein